MLTAKGNSYRVLLDMVLSDRLLTVHIPLQQNLLGDITPEMVDKAIPFISELIQTEKRGSGVMQKELLRIEHHRDQLCDAYLSLWLRYVTAITPQTRQSAMVKVQQDMMNLMSDKTLRQFAHGVFSANVPASADGAITADDFILPDERQKLIDAVIIAIKEQQ